MGTGLKSLESCRSVEEITATCPFTASYVVPVLVPKEEEKGGELLSVEPRHQVFSI